MSRIGLDDAAVDARANALPHRLPTVSAAAALRRATAAGNSISTGSKQVDSLLNGGLVRGKVVEVHGPPGSGKTSLAISAAINGLTDDGKVVWIDCGFATDLSRLNTAAKIRPGTDDAKAGDEEPQTTLSQAKLHHYEISALAQLLALLLHPPADFPPKDTRLLVIDSISTLFAAAFPNNYIPSSNTNNTETKQQWAAGRRWSLQRDVVSTLNKLAAVHNMAVLVTCQMSTKFDKEYSGSGRPKAMLKPSMDTKSWKEGIWGRILLFRHWGPQQVATAEAKASEAGQQENTKPINRYAGLVKLGGVEHEICGRFVPFTITDTGIADVRQAQDDSNGTTLAIAVHQSTEQAQGQQTIPAKRHLAEIADSASEDELANLPDLADDDEVQELNEMGLTRSEQAQLELDLENKNNE